MFNGIRLHTSGNIFYDEEKFNLFNNIENIEFNILRVSLNSKEDMKILGYNIKYYKNDFIISNNRFMNYNEEDVTIKEIHKLLENKICIN